MYLLDANVFIEAKNFYYSFDIFPSYWQWLDAAQAAAQLASIRPICDELLKGNDELAAWAKERRHGTWFLSVDDEATQIKFRNIAAWITSQPFAPYAQADFLSGGDPWLVAKAATSGATVVTLERLDLRSRKKIFIPTVCHQFGLRYVNTFEMLHQLGAKF